MKQAPELFVNEDYGWRGEVTSISIAYYYPFITHSESFLRFPDDEDSLLWEWEALTSLAQTFSLKNNDHREIDRPSVYFADWLAQTLNTKNLLPGELQNVIGQSGSEWILLFTPTRPPAGYSDSWLVAISRDEDIHYSGSATFVWLAKADGIYTAYPLIEFYPYRLWGWITTELVDMNQDGFEEIILSIVTEENFVGSVTQLHVFDVSGQKPQELVLFPNDYFGALWESATYIWGGGWDLLASETKSPIILIRADLGAGCGINQARQYQWNGEALTLQSSNYAITDSGNFAAYCSFNVFVWSDSPDPLSQLWELLIPFWPLDDLFWDGEKMVPQPPGARDEARFRVAIFTGLAGHYDEAIVLLNEIISNPTTPDSGWLPSVSKFLSTYKSQDDLYRACQTTPLCTAWHAIEYLVDSAKLETNSATLEALKNWGVVVYSSGEYDFDQDGQSEIWFTVRHRFGEPIQFWILAEYPEGTKALYIAEVEQVSPPIESILSSESGKTYSMIAGNAYSLVRLPQSREPFIAKVPPYRVAQPLPPETLLEDLTLSLFSGTDPAEIRTQLLALEQVPGSHFLYLLGLTYELTGDERAAVNTYLELWRTYPESPFTIMARMKLEQK